MRVGNYRKVSQNPIEDGTSHDWEGRKLGEANLEPPSTADDWCVLFSYLGRVAEVLVWFENHLSVRMVKYNGESAQHLRADGSRNIGNRGNAGRILGKLA
jgi:hypothetical protein